MSKRGHGETCTYCKRALESVSSRSRVAATKDHVLPKSMGGRVTVWCCRQCNNIKGDMLPEQWQEFMTAMPEWWKLPRYARHGRHRREQAPIKPLDFTKLSTPPAAVPVEFPNDPVAQAAFAGVYGGRLHMLRPHGQDTG